MGLWVPSGHSPRTVAVGSLHSVIACWTPRRRIRDDQFSPVGCCKSNFPTYSSHPPTVMTAPLPPFSAQSPPLLTTAVTTASQWDGTSTCVHLVLGVIRYPARRQIPTQ